MTDRTDAEDEWHQPLRPVARGSQCRTFTADGVLTAGSAVPDLKLPLATVEPEQCSDRAPKAAADGALDAD